MRTLTFGWGWSDTHSLSGNTITTCCKLRSSTCNFRPRLHVPHKYRRSLLDAVRSHFDGFANALASQLPANAMSGCRGERTHSCPPLVAESCAPHPLQVQLHFRRLCRVYALRQVLVSTWHFSCLAPSARVPWIGPLSRRSRAPIRPQLHWLSAVMNPSLWNTISSRSRLRPAVDSHRRWSDRPRALQCTICACGSRTVLTVLRFG